MGLIAVALSGGIGFGARVWERTEAEVGRGELARGGQAFLRALLSNAYPRRQNPARPDDSPAFKGTSEEMQFVAPAPPALPMDSLVTVTLSAKREGGALFVSYQAEREGAPTRTDALLSGATAIRFAYGEIANGAIAWSDTWERADALPALIRVRIAFPPESGLSWPDLIVRPAIDKDAACIYDPVSFDCRNG